MAQQSCATHELYHVYNRGVDKRFVFMDDEDRNYFIHLLFALNGPESYQNIHREYHIKRNHAEYMLGSRNLPTIDKRSRLVDILCFTLMPNHYHLLLRQRVDDGIALFMQKVGTGYTMFFNGRYQRTGSLFQGTYKRVLVDNERYLLWLPHYIHLNPLALMTQVEQPITFLEKYKWGSYADYTHNPHFSSILETSTILDMFGGREQYYSDLKQYTTKPASLLCEDPSLLLEHTFNE